MRRLIQRFIIGIRKTQIRIKFILWYDFHLIIAIMFDENLAKIYNVFNIIK